MLWNDSVLYLHVPKTGGMTVSKRLLERLPRPVYCAVPSGHESGPDDVRAVPGIRHETLDDARTLLAGFGRTLDSFARILVTIRNPMALEVSRYFFLRMGSPHDRNSDQELADNVDFPTFAARSTFYGREEANIERWILLDGEPLPNLVVVRQERLEEDLSDALASVGLGHIASGLDTVNASRHEDYRTYLTPDAERTIYRRYRWVYDSGLYPRPESIE